MIQNCLASLPEDLPHSDGGMRIKAEPMDTEDSINCIGSNEQQRTISSLKKDQVLDKDANMCSIIDEMT